jgi:hypothetical protein
MMADDSAVDTSCADALREGDPARSDTGGNVETSKEPCRDEKVVLDMKGDPSRGEKTRVLVDEPRFSRGAS